MAEPTPDPASLKPSNTRRSRLVDVGLEAVSLSMLGFIAMGLLVHGGRREISRELAQGWLRERGVDAVVTVDDLDASGFSGSILVGSRSDPIFAADRIEVVYDMTAPWTGGPFAIDTRAVRLVRPRLKASLNGEGRLGFGPLQRLIDEALNAPPKPGSTGPAILIENGRLDLLTPGGMARITGDASLDDGRLLRLDGRLAPMRYVSDALVAEARGALLSARKRGDRLTIAARFDLANLVQADLELDDAQGQIDADIAYPDLAMMSATGAVDIGAVFKAASARAGAIHTADSAASLALTGTLDGTLAQGRFDGQLTGRARGGMLESPGLSARDIGLELDLTHVAASRLGQKMALQARGPVLAEADQALAGVTAFRGVSAQLDLAGLILSVDPAGAVVSGPLALQGSAARLASGGLALASVAAQARGQVSGPLVRPDLTLNGTAGADSGVSRPDAERLTGFLPDPAAARAAAQALQTFDLGVAAFKLTLSDGRILLALPKPISLVAANGVRASIAAPYGPLLDGTIGQMRGGVAVDLSGGGLPTLRLDAPDWQQADGMLSSHLAITGDHIDLAPLQGLAGHMVGQARLSGQDFRFDLTGCQPLTATRLRLGETLLTNPKVTVCPGAGPALTIRDGAWAADARFNGLTLSLDEAQATVEDGAGKLVASGPGGPTRAEVRLEQGLLRDAAASRRFNPIKATGRLLLSGGLWTGTLDAATPVGLPLGRITLRHDLARARGRAELDASTLAFSRDGLQPGDLSPMAAWATQATGPAAFTGLLAWDADGMKSHGRLVAGQIDFTSPVGFAANLEGAIDFTSLSPLVSAPYQTLKIASIDSVLPLEGLAVVFNLGPESVHVSSAALQAAKGRISIEPTDVSLEPQGLIRGVIIVQHLDLGDLIAASSLVEKVQLDAVVDGRLPFEFGPKGLRFLDGRITATKPGRLAISRSALTGVQAGVQGQDADSPGAPPPPPDPGSPGAPVNAIQDFAYQAMENLSFTNLDAVVNSTDQGRLAVLFHIKGEHDPKVAEKARVGLLDLLRGKAFNKRIALPARTPVDLTLDTSLNFDELLAAWRRAYKGQDPDPPRSAPVQP